MYVDDDTSIKKTGGSADEVGLHSLFVRDMERSLAFYRELAGMKVVNQFHPSRGEIVFLANEEGETMLELIHFDSHEKIATNKGMLMTFAVKENDLAAIREKAIAMGFDPAEIVTDGPETPNFKVKDPDGVVIKFCE